MTETRSHVIALHSRDSDWGTDFAQLTVPVHVTRKEIVDEIDIAIKMAKEKLTEEYGEDYENSAADINVYVMRHLAETFGGKYAWSSVILHGYCVYD